MSDFITCGDCECQSCLRNHSCPMTDLLESPCNSCGGIPPYAPEIADETNLGEFGCKDKKHQRRIKKPSELFY